MATWSHEPFGNDPVRRSHVVQFHGRPFPANCIRKVDIINDTVKSLKNCVSQISARDLIDVMRQSIVHVALVVRDYDEAIAFYTNKLHFTLVEDTYQPEQHKRWVVVSPPNSVGTTLLLAKAATA